jgi:carboxypeptidase Q
MSANALGMMAAMRLGISVAAAACFVGAASPLRAAARSDVLARIRTEEATHSQVMRSVHFLSDVYGPRLTASPGEKAAGRWALDQFRSWGLTNVHLEPWDFGHPGWANMFASGSLISPVRAPLSFAVSAWTPGTKGRIRGRAVQIVPPTSPTIEQLDRYLASMRSKVRSRIVLIGQGTVAPPDDPIPYRFDQAEMAHLLNSHRPSEPDAPQDPKILSGSQINRRLDAFLVSAGALMRVSDAQRRNGLIGARRNETYELRKSPPAVTLRNEDFGRIVRIMADGTPVTLEFDVRNRSYPAGRLSGNVIAEIPGTDRSDEIVMLGAHLDSWQVATGATDDGVGCAIMMEAVRILNAIGFQPRRTIRIALWTGEEQGLFGSQDYVARHFGTAENPRPEFAKLDAYLNIDGGTGRVRAVNVFGPSAAAEVLRNELASLSDVGVVGAVPHRIRSLRGTDTTTFSRAGLPGIGLMQDPIEYGTVTWHTNLDLYEGVLEGDARQAAIVAATLVAELASQDEMLPRYMPGELPPPVGPAPMVRQCLVSFRRAPCTDRLRRSRPAS